MIQATASGSLVLGLLALLLSVGNAQAVPCKENFPPSNPDSVYIDHGDGTVTDTSTGLMWKQCTEGLSGATCQIGSDQSFNWADALAHAEASTFGDYTDWRLPNVKELYSLVEDCRVAPAINMSLFPSTPIARFWSGSPRALGPTDAWLVDFNFGNISSVPRSEGDGRYYNRVRLVRGGH